MFGLPVIALEHFGLRLGGAGAEPAVWVGLLQALLAGWVVYVAASGMLVECLLIRRIKLDGAVALAAMIAYLASLAGWARLLLLRSPSPPRTFWFDIAVIALIVWCGLRWGWLANRART